MLYFNQNQYSITTQEEAQQLVAVLNLKKMIQGGGKALYTDYTGLDNFKSQVDYHLHDFMRKAISRKEKHNILEIQKKLQESSKIRDVDQLSEQARTKGEQSYQQSLLEFTEACETAMFRLSYF